MKSIFPKPSDFTWGESGLPDKNHIPDVGKKVLYKNTRDNRIHKEGFDAGYKKGFKEGLKNVSGWSKEYEKMMIGNL